MSTDATAPPVCHSQDALVAALAFSARLAAHHTESGFPGYATDEFLEPFAGYFDRHPVAEGPSIAALDASMTTGLAQSRKGRPAAAHPDNLIQEAERLLAVLIQHPVLAQTSSRAPLCPALHSRRPGQ